MEDIYYSTFIVPFALYAVACILIISRQINRAEMKYAIRSQGVLAAGLGIVIGLSGCNHGDSSHAVPPQIEFDRAAWISASVNGENIRDRMKGSIKKNLPVGTPLAEVLKKLGTPDLVRSKEDVGRTEGIRLADTDDICISYTIYTDENWPDDLNFIFGRDGQLKRVVEQIR